MKNTTMAMIIKDTTEITSAVFANLKLCNFDKYLIGIDDKYTDDSIHTYIKQHNFDYMYFTFENFAQARNDVIKYVTTKYCFFVDSDETLPVYLADGLNIDTILQKVDAVSMPRYNWEDLFMKKLHFDMQRNEDRQLRIFRTDKGIQYTGKVHETLTTSNIKHLQLNELFINHFAFALRTADDWTIKNQFYKELSK